jgi:HEAT repeat protein
MVKLGGSRSEPTLRSALEDPSPRVRRRAAILATGLGPAVGSPLLARAALDADAAVRRVAMLSLASFGGEPARSALLEGADDADLAVRRAACQGLSRLLGEPLLSLSDEPPARRTRELRRLQTAPLAPLRELAHAPPAEGALREASHRPEPAAAAPAEVEPEAEVASGPAPSTAERVIREIATSLRGRTLQELAAVAGEEDVAAATAHLIDAGRLVRRNQRFFLA